jgi:hypothetical protein
MKSIQEFNCWLLDEETKGESGLSSAGTTDDLQSTVDCLKSSLSALKFD